LGDFEMENVKKNPLHTHPSHEVRSTIHEPHLM
jgi:hypothetical protein